MSEQARAALITIGGSGLVTAVAIGLSLLFNTPLLPQMQFSLSQLGIGVVATLPMAGFLYAFMKTSHPPVVEFRNSQIEYFGSLGFSLTLPRIVVIGLLAGVSEELLFRGVLHVLADRYIPLVAAIILTNVLFGALHARTLAYAVIAGLVGCYLGAVFAMTGSLVAPIVAHALYDMIALDVTRRALLERGEAPA